MLERNIKLVGDKLLFNLRLNSNACPNTALTLAKLTAVNLAAANRISSNYILFVFFLCAVLFSNTAFSAQSSRSLKPIAQNPVIQNQPQAADSQVRAANEIIFIDSAVADQPVLLDAMQRNAEVVILPADVDGFTYIAKILRKRLMLDAVNLDAIHMVSHGDAGQLRLGSAKINVNTLQSYSDEIAVIRNVLDGDILLYGCDVAKGNRGQEFISAFAESTNAAVLASNNLTGDAAQGGDWVLETRQGDVQTDTIFSGQQVGRYTSVLADPVISSSPNTSAIENSAYSYTIIASDVDVGDILTFSALVKPTWLNFDAINHVLSGTPTNADVGSHNVTLRVNDGTLDVDQNFTITVLDSNVAPTGSVSISGITTEGQTLTAVNNSIADANGLGVFSFQWKSGGAIVGGNSGTYVLTQSDVGNTLTVTISYTDGAGTLESLPSAATPVVLDSNVAPTGSVSISGIATEGQTLTAVNNSIADANGLGVFSYQWKRSGANVGSNSNTYFLTQPDVGNTLTVTISYTDGAGTLESLPSIATAPIINTSYPPTGSIVISGSATEGQTLTATDTIADADGLGAFSYKWLRSGVEINGTTLKTYTLVQADVGNVIRVRVTYLDGGNTAEVVESVDTAAVINVNNTPAGALTINGTVAQNQVLTAITSNITDEDGLGVFSYQWLRGGQAVVGATTNTYALVQQDVGALFSVRVTFTDGGNTVETVVSAQTAPVANVNDAPVGVLTISGSVVQNQVLTANASTITDIDGLGAFSYQWLRGGVIIDGATTSTYTLVQQDVGGSISAGVSYTDGGGTVEQVFSGALGPVANVNDIGIVTIVGGATDGSLITIADITDIDGTGSSNFSYQWLRDGASIGGKTSDSYTVVLGDVGKFISVVVSYTDDLGAAETVTSNTIGAIRPDVPKVTAPPEISLVNANGWFTFVVLDPDSVATAFDTLDNSFIAPVSDSNGQFRPGETIVTWSATDEAGNVGTATQIVKVVPMAEVSKVQRVAEGGNYAFKIILNGDALQYPVTVPYTVSNSNLGTGSADSSDHNLVASSATVIEPASPGELPEAVINFSVVDDGVNEGVETVIVTLIDTPVNAVIGPFFEHTIEIVEANVAPSVSLELSQLQVGVNDAPVMVFAIADDVNGNEGEGLSYDWSGTDNTISNASGKTYSVDPGGLEPGFYTLQVTVDDNTATENATATDTLILHVIEALPELDSDSDTDGDGADDEAEGFTDSDGDGVAEYLDALKASNVIQILPAASDKFIMQTEPGLKLKLAEISLKANRGSTLVEEQDVIDFANGSAVEADTVENIGGYFDFTVSGLPVPGQVVNVVIPQLSELPRVPVYRKLTESGWQDFVVDSNNSVSSAAGKKGYCPPPGDSAYQAGLQQGHWCLQLTIEDGGANDSDGKVNQRITDPGGLGRVLSSVNVSSGGGGGGSFNPIIMILSAFILLAFRRQRVDKK